MLFEEIDTWQTVYGEPEEQVSGVDTGEPLAPPDADTTPPKTPNEDKEVPCQGCDQET